MQPADQLNGLAPSTTPVGVRSRQQAASPASTLLPASSPAETSGVMLRTEHHVIAYMGGLHTHLRQPSTLQADPANPATPYRNGHTHSSSTDRTGYFDDHLRNMTRLPLPTTTSDGRSLLQTHHISPFDHLHLGTGGASAALSLNSLAPADHSPTTLAPGDPPPPAWSPMTLTHPSGPPGFHRSSSEAGNQTEAHVGSMVDHQPSFPPNPLDREMLGDVRTYATVPGRPFSSEGGLTRPPLNGLGFGGSQSSDVGMAATSASLPTTAAELTSFAGSWNPGAASSSPQDLGSHMRRRSTMSSTSTNAPVTVGDIVGRTVQERRKRPIPQDPDKLIQLDAPIPPRRNSQRQNTLSSERNSKDALASAHESPASGEQQGGSDGHGSDHGSGFDLQRGSKRKYKSEEVVNEAEAKRIRNTLAARRHRLHKATQWKNMKSELDTLRARNAELEARKDAEVSRLQSDCARLTARVQLLEAKIAESAAKNGQHNRSNTNGSHANGSRMH